MKRLVIWIMIPWFVVGCTGIPTVQWEDRGRALSNLYDGAYDSNTLLVRPREMSLERVIESLHIVRTEVTFKTDEDGRLVKKELAGTALALFGRYLLTVQSPFGIVVIPAKKVSERTVLEHGGKRYALEPLVVDKAVDVALFRIPEGLALRSFPYRIGNSDDLSVGNFVYLVGNPMNIGINVREGIVSSLKAPAAIEKTDAIAENAFMVSSGLNPGDSGTPVIAIRDGAYELVGLSQGSFLASQRLGWVIRINEILRRIEGSLETPAVTMLRR